MKLLQFPSQTVHQTYEVWISIHVRGDGQLPMPWTLEQTERAWSMSFPTFQDVQRYLINRLGLTTTEEICGYVKTGRNDGFYLTPEQAGSIGIPVRCLDK